MSSQDDSVFLVSGAGGWLGSRLVDVIINGLDDAKEFVEEFPARRVRCLVQKKEQADQLRRTSDKIEIIVGDLRNKNDCENFVADCDGGVLFHTAGVIHPKAIRDFFEVNVDGTKKLLGAAVNAGIRRVVAVSSSAVCGCNPAPDHRFDESSPYKPYMSYGRSKMLMEQHVGELHSQGVIETVIVRPPWFYGPFQPPRQTLFFKMIRDGKCPVVGGGMNMRSMAYIDNLCQGLLLAAMKYEAVGKTYWIADQHAYSMNEILDTVEELLAGEFQLPCKRKRLYLPSIASEIARFVDFGIQSIGLYPQKFHVLSEMNKTIACSIDKARKELGYEPTVSLQEGMRRSIAWCLENGGIQ